MWIKFFCLFAYYGSHYQKFEIRGQRESAFIFLKQTFLPSADDVDKPETIELLNDVYECIQAIERLINFGWKSSHTKGCNSMCTMHTIAKNLPNIHFVFIFPNKRSKSLNKVFSKICPAWFSVYF